MGYPLSESEVAAMTSSNSDPYKNFIDSTGIVNDPAVGLGVPLVQDTGD